MKLLEKSDLDEGFLEGEERCGFFVNEEMKRVWASEMRVLSYIIEICKENDIRYFMDFGSLLGAVRHKGFVPWDDDIDLGLKRADYMKLLTALKNDKDSEYHLLGPYFEDKSKQAFSKIVTYNEIPLPKAVYERNFECPYIIGIDLFPFDYVPRDKELSEVWHDMYAIVYDTAVKFDEFRDNGSLGERLSLIEDMCHVSIDRQNLTVSEIWKLADSVASMFGEDESDELADMAMNISEKYNIRIGKELMNDFIEMDFECMKVSVPKHYDELLRSIYGDYMVIKKNGAGHEYCFFNEQKEFLQKLGKWYV